MTSNNRPTLRARHAGAAAVLACLALLLACIPAAIARSSHERSTSESSAPTPVSEPSDSAGETHAERKAAAEATPVPASKGERHSKHTAATTPAGEAPSSEATTTTAAPGARHGGQPHAQSGGRGGQDTAHRGQGDRRQQGAGGATGDTGRSTQPADSHAKANAKSGGGADSSAEGRRAQERAEKPRGASHVAKGKAKSIEAARPAGLPSETPSATTTSTAPASSAGATTATTVAGALATQASVATTAAPSIVRHTAQKASARTRRTGRAKAHGGGSTGAAAVRSPATAAAPVAPASTRAPSRHTKQAPTHSAPVRRSSPLVNTITRFVGVVPTPIWIAIGVLAALALAMTGRSRLSVIRARRLERQRGELLEDVGLLQTALLPDTPARLGPVGTSAAYRPAAGPGAGGDFYDVFALEDGQLAVIVGDVSGHGRKALPHTALLRFTLRAYLEAGLSPRGAVQTAGAVLERQLGGSFATVIAATYNPRERRLVYASAGHPPPIVRSSEAGAQAIEAITVSSSLPIGVGPTGTRQSTVSVPGAAEICFFTDGVTEARIGSELYGVERLEDALAELGPQATASELLDSVAGAADRRPDDMAACLLHIEGGVQAPRAEAEELELGREEGSSPRTEQFLLACGVSAERTAQVMRSAREEAERSGSVLLEVRRHEEGSEVTLGHDNLAYLQTRHAARQADLKVSR
ncbi:MAG: PP2C family protein-serine/threonine phosphatase [Solirubrobacteraceae bacterium]